MEKPKMFTEPEAVRRKLAEVCRKETDNRRWTKKERAAFRLMAEAWERTLKKE
jgi:hypothetical protein